MQRQMLLNHVMTGPYKFYRRLFSQLLNEHWQALLPFMISWGIISSGQSHCDFSINPVTLSGFSDRLLSGDSSNS